MKTIDEILEDWYPTIPDEEHNGLYARDKVKLIAQEFADQFRQPDVIKSVCYHCEGKGFVYRDPITSVKRTCRICKGQAVL